MSDNNIDMLKRNIKQLMKENDITQAEFAAETGISQPRLSKILNSTSDKDCFTVAQLVDIAKALKVSTDDLLGIRSKTEDTNKINFSDICNKLFEIDDMIGLKIGICETDLCEINSFTNESTPITTEGIYFENEPLTNILKEWRECKAMETTNPKIKENIIRTWMKGTLDDAHQRKLEWDFRTQKEQGKHLAELLLESRVNKRFPISPELFEWTNIEVLSNYMDNLEYNLDFDEDDHIILLDAYSDWKSHVSPIDELHFN